MDDHDMGDEAPTTRRMDRSPSISPQMGLWGGPSLSTEVDPGELGPIGPLERLFYEQIATLPGVPVAIRDRAAEVAGVDPQVPDLPPPPPPQDGGDKGGGSNGGMGGQGPGGMSGGSSGSSGGAGVLLGIGILAIFLLRQRG